MLATSLEGAMQLGLVAITQRAKRRRCNKSLEPKSWKASMQCSRLIENPNRESVCAGRD